MKKIAIALLLVAAISLPQISCKKFPIPKERVCQVKSIRHTYEGKESEVKYFYNNDRLLTSITGDRSLDPPSPVTTTISYNNQDKPISGANFNGTSFRYVYENGNVERVEDLGDGGEFILAYRYVYDDLGRVIQRTGRDSSVWYFEYSDNSRNYTRVRYYIWLRPDFGPELFSVEEFQYDDKANPWTTWLNMPLNPFDFNIVSNGVSIQMPIPANNVTNYKLYFTQRGQPLLSDEFIYTYQYDEQYPKVQNVERNVYNPFIPGYVETYYGINYYTYECVGGKGNWKK
jgi:hypothetical protein